MGFFVVCILRLTPRASRFTIKKVREDEISESERIRPGPSDLTCFGTTVPFPLVRLEVKE